MRAPSLTPHHREALPRWARADYAAVLCSRGILPLWLFEGPLAAGMSRREVVAVAAAEVAHGKLLHEAFCCSWQGVRTGVYHIYGQI